MTSHLCRRSRVGPRERLPNRLARVIGIVAALLAGAASPSLAQSTTPTTTPTPGVTTPGATGVGAVATRADLQTAAASGGPQAAAARERLANGDFQVGDRIALVVQGEPTMSDTLAVRANQVVHVASLPDISLHGVLRSELEAYLKQQLGKYLRNPDLRAVSLVRVDVLGPVVRPGFYTAPADELVSDVIMQAGGLASNADVAKTTVHRGGVMVQSVDRVQAALAHGETLDQLDVRAGDAIVIGERPPGGNLLRVLAVVGGIAGIAVSVVLITRH